MRICHICAIVTLVTGLSLMGCDKGEVLIDEGEHTVKEDTIRIFKSVPDSIMLAFETDADWTIGVAKGGEWCSVSQNGGPKGHNELLITVVENPTVNERKTSVILESGTAKRVFRITQKAGEQWFETLYWSRTAAQRFGLRGKVQVMTTADKRHPNKQYTYNFDRRGNLLSRVCDDIEFNRFDTTQTYTYDDANHRLTCIVTAGDDDTVRIWQYKYGNTGHLVAYSANRWDDPDPLAEDMVGMVVPDLSDAIEYWSVDDRNYRMSRHYTFDENDHLTIISGLCAWEYGAADSVVLEADTVRVTYKISNGIKLPYTSRNVVNTTYFKNNMLRMLETKDFKNEYMDNVQKLAVVSYIYKGEESGQGIRQAYECSFNYNRDPLERKVQYPGILAVEKYYNYQYDNMDNWNYRSEDVPRPGSTESQLNTRRREFVYW